MRRKLILAAIVVSAGILTSLLLPRLLWPNRISIQNDCGNELRDVQVELRDLHGHVFLDKLVPYLGAGDSIPLRHKHNDFKVTLRYAHTGELREYESEIDLWKGEEYILAVQPDGLVEGWYDGSRAK